MSDSVHFEFVSDSEHDTRVLGRHIGRLLQPGFVLALNGTLGSGKTRLTKAIAEGLDIDSSSVNSPTFTLSVPHTGRLELLHVDAYRLNSLTEVDQLGLDEWVDDGGVLIVEWANTIQTALPPFDLEIELTHVSDRQRRISVVACSGRAAPLVREIEVLAEPK